MNRIFCDTSGLYALLDRRNAYGERATAAWRRFLADSTPLVTTNYVFLECATLLQARIGLRAVAAFREIAEAFVETHWVDRTLHVAALDQLQSLDRRGLMVDCSSFAFMRRNALTHAFTFDRHFEEFGFERVGDS